MVKNNGSPVTYTYNDEGIRTSKTVSGIKYTYHLSGSQIIAEEFGNHLFIYLYDADGSPIGMQYRNTSYADGVFDVYWFEKNLQGDIVAVYDDAGNKLVWYSYDAWGNTRVFYYNTPESVFARQNPFRYRGYYYDSESGLYYLNSRYYDPKTGRFISADGILSGADKSLHGKNLFAYCFNNPIMYVDDSGEFPLVIVLLVVGAVIGGVVGALSDEKLLSPVNSRNLDEENSSPNELALGDRVINTVVGVLAGAAAAGGAIVVVGVGASIAAGSATVAVSWLGMTGAQAVASGLLAYDLFPIFIAPFTGQNVEVLEYPS